MRTKDEEEEVVTSADESLLKKRAAPSSTNETPTKTPTRPSKALKTATKEEVVGFGSVEESLNRDDSCEDEMKKKKDNLRYRWTRFQGLKDAPLRGGFGLLNIKQELNTLSFCFKNNNKWYGVSSGHWAELGDSVYAHIGEGDDTARCIGHVVSKSIRSDSLIFEIDATTKDLRIQGEMILAEKSGLGDQPFRLAPSDDDGLEVGTLLGGFGAARRGTIGKVKTLSASPAAAQRHVYFEGDVGIVHYKDGEESRVTFPGDCGMILIDKYGYGRLMHHVIEIQEPGKGSPESTKYESFGVPLEKVFATHELLGGTYDPEDNVRVSSSYEGSPRATVRLEGGAHIRELHESLVLPNVKFEDILIYSCYEIDSNPNVRLVP